MADTKISAATDTTPPLATDMLPLARLGDGTARKISIGNFLNNAPASTFSNLHTFGAGAVFNTVAPVFNVAPQFAQGLTVDPGKKVIISTDLGEDTPLSVFRNQFSNTGVATYGAYINYSSHVRQTGPIYGLDVELNHIPDALNSTGQNAIGANFNLTKSGTFGMDANSFMVAVGAVIGNSGTGTIPHAIGYYLDHSFSGVATITETVGFDDILGFAPAGASVVTNYMGFRFQTPQMGGGSIVNQWAFYAENVLGAGTLNYSIFTNRGDVSLMSSPTQDKLGLWGATPVVRPTKAGHNNWATIADVTAALAALGLVDVA